MNVRVLFDDGDIRDEVYSIGDKEVAFVHRSEYYTILDIAGEKGYERILKYIDLDGDIRSITIVEELEAFRVGGRIGFYWGDKVMDITNQEEIEAFLDELVFNPDFE